MKNLSEYITNLDFDYAISYSGLRAHEFDVLEKSNKSQMHKIEEEIKAAGFAEKSHLQKKYDDLAGEINIYNSRIIDQNGNLHKSTKLIRRFEKSDKRLNRIFEILNIKFEEQHFWMCPPIFRDAIVFYSKADRVSGILQMCFSCTWIKNENEEDFEVDYKIFPRLKDELINLGHKVENE